MRLLTIFICTVAVIFISCSYKGSTTPGGAFVDMTKSFEQKDAILLEMTLSMESKKKFNDAAKLVSELPEIAFTHYCIKNSLNPEKARNFNTRIFIQAYINSNLEKSDTLFETFKSGIKEIKIIDQKATITAGNGAILYFVKEGSFWKFDAKYL